MYQVCDEIINLKHKMRPFIYLKVNGETTIIKQKEYDYLLVKKDTNKILNPNTSHLLIVKWSLKSFL